ncbi:MAG: glycosyltransferase family 4 protein [Euryarchaeota archaeon]|nr:glycosyltransferase family 4 protein [Euryarchaeota archaeon]
MIVEWHSYELPSHGLAGDPSVKLGLVGGLGVVSDEVLSRISGEVTIYGIGSRYLRGEELPIYEEIDGYRVIRPFFTLDGAETVRRCRDIFVKGGFEFSPEHEREIPMLPFLSDYTLAIPEVRFQDRPDLLCGHDWISLLGTMGKSFEHDLPFAAFLHSLEPGRQGGVVHTREGPRTVGRGYYTGSRTIRDIEALSVLKSRACFTVGTTMVRELLEFARAHGISSPAVKHKVFPIHHGVDTRTYRPLGLEKEYDIILITRFAPVKGVMEFLEAVSRLRKGKPDLRVRLIGGGELEDRIREEVRARGLQETVSISTRWLQPGEKAREINKARVGVAPSKYEPHGMVDLEVGACGVPCVVGTGGFSERTIDGVTGVLCDPFDAGDIAEKIWGLLRDSEEAEEIGGNARDFISRNYDWEVRARIYPELFEAVVERDFRALKDLPLTVPLEMG